jgi:hypothetical protein
MRFENWEKWISAIAKLGAVGSILFFAIELQQNNKQLEAQARYAQFGSKKQGNGARPTITKALYCRTSELTIPESIY